MNWHRYLVDLPARAVTLWWTGYSLLLGAVFMVLATLMVIVLVLNFGFGIRWGW